MTTSWHYYASALGLPAEASTASQLQSARAVCDTQASAHEKWFSIQQSMSSKRRIRGRGLGRVWLSCRRQIAKQSVGCPFIMSRRASPSALLIQAWRAHGTTVHSTWLMHLGLLGPAALPSRTYSNTSASGSTHRHVHHYESLIACTGRCNNRPSGRSELSCRQRPDSVKASKAGLSRPDNTKLKHTNVDTARQHRADCAAVRLRHVSRGRGGTA